MAHYLIHSYDFPPIAPKGLPAAQRYAAIAPSAPHALHMPSHIFTRVGAWQESIESNRASANAAQEELGRRGSRRTRLVQRAPRHGLHGLRLPAARPDREARAVLGRDRAIRKLDVDNFVAAFAFAAIPARYTLERRPWAEAAALTLHPPELGWQRFPQAESIHWFARGSARRAAATPRARARRWRALEALRDGQVAAKSAYWAEQAEIQRRGVEAWLARAEGRTTRRWP